MKQNSSLEVETVKDHLQRQITEWTSILNTHYETDVGTDITEYAKGALTAYVELKAFIEYEERNGKNE